MNVADYRGLPTPGQWERMIARRVLLEIYDAAVAAGQQLDADSFRRVADRRYPFMPGNEARQAWLLEREMLSKAVTEGDPQPGPGDDAVCMVARDIIEGDPARRAEAIALMDRDAPHRLARRCPICAAASGRDCFDGPPPDETGGKHTRRRRIPVPHAARLQPYPT